MIWGTTYFHFGKLLNLFLNGGPNSLTRVPAEMSTDGHMMHVQIFKTVIDQGFNCPLSSPFMNGSVCGSGGVMTGQLLRRNCPVI